MAGKIMVGAWLIVLGLGANLELGATAQESKGDKKKDVWTDPQDKTLPASFKLQGEYVGQISGGAKLGAQVIDLSQNTLQAVVYPGGLPGDGWDGIN